MKKMYYILKKNDETVAMTYSKEMAELICKTIGFECIIRVAMY